MASASTHPRRARVLVVEDDHAFRRLIAAVLRRCGYLVDEAASGFEMLDRLGGLALRARAFDLIVTDVRMPGPTGLEIIDGLKRGAHGSLLSSTPVLFMTAFGDEAAHREAERLGATMLDKPFDLDELGACALRIVPPCDDDELAPELGNGD